MSSRLQLRRLLDRPVRVVDLAEMLMWLAAGYLAVGMAWSFMHPEAVQRLQDRLENQIPLPIEASYQLAALGEASVLWPVIPVLPSPSCAH